MLANRTRPVGPLFTTGQKPFSSARSFVHRRSSGPKCASYNSDKGSNKAVLEAFFIGRAFAETVNDRLGAALGDLLSEIAKADAERRQAWKEFQTEVQERAQLELTKARESGGSSQRQLPETATLPRTTTGKPIGPVSTSYSQPQTLPRTTSGKPDGPGGRTYSQPSTLPRTTTGKPISPARRGPTQAQTSMTGPGISPRLQETVDDIRAETASSRAILQQIKSSQGRTR